MHLHTSEIFLYARTHNPPRPQAQASWGLVGAGGRGQGGAPCQGHCPAASRLPALLSPPPFFLLVCPPTFPVPAPCPPTFPVRAPWTARLERPMEKQKYSLGPVAYTLCLPLPLPWLPPACPPLLPLTFPCLNACPPFLPCLCPCPPPPTAAC